MCVNTKGSTEFIFTLMCATSFPFGKVRKKIKQKTQKGKLAIIKAQRTVNVNDSAKRCKDVGTRSL